MTRRHSYYRGLKGIAALAAIAVLLATLDLAIVELNHLAGESTWGLLGMLPSIVPAALQALQVFALDYGRSLQCPLETLVSSWPLLAVIVAAI